MMEILKRYALAFLILAFVIGLMLVGTYLVKSFGDKMFEGTDISIKPKGERVIL
ncbi:MAG: hypothetical protein PHW94_05480 [Sulfurimonas sp.]|nr:hypothetical protein [Sulfurimonas sp.]MDD3060374.1 hypothetical protein [Sulfurimonas sp.]